jgi:UDPglucose 6-dehydrogenase
MARAGELDADQAVSFLREVDLVNRRRRSRTVDLAREEVGGSFLGRRVLDARNALDPDVWRAAGWTYRALGRPH